jgi:hypothetical protein
MANKKINQLVSKTSILSTDLFPLGDGTTGQLFKKTVAELQAAIGGAVISVNGLVGTVVLDTDDIQELATPTNKYFTEARARGSISLTVSGASGASTYNSSTGVLNVPTYTLAGLGGITASFLSGGTGITYNSGTGVIAYSGTVYTDASVRGLFSGGTGITYNSSTGAISYSGTVYTDSSVRALFSGTSPITYNSSTGAIGITGANLTEATSSVLTITGGTGALLSATSIQVKQASGSENGFLSSTDWTTFNNKAGALSGTTNFISKFTSSSAIGNSIIFDNGTNVGISTTSPAQKLDVNGAIRTLGNFFAVNNTPFSTNGTITNHDTVGLVLRGVAGFAYDFSIYNPAGNALIGNPTGTNTIFFPTGNVGIGNNNPDFGSSGDKVLTIQGTSTRASVNLQNSSTGTSGVAGSLRGFNGSTFLTSMDMQASATNSGNFVFFTNNAGSIGERMRISANGNVGIGSNNPTYKLQVEGTSFLHGDVSFGLYGETTIFRSVQVLNYLVVGGSENITFQTFSDGWLARMTITNNGNILMGTTSNNGERLYVSGNIRATGTITANSDISLKKNLLKIENALEKVEQINGYTYEFKSDDSKRHAGVIAQEIEGVLPEIVNKGNDGILGVEYGNISALLIEAIKEQQKKINELEVKLIALGQ